MSYRTAEDFAREAREWWRLLRGQIRRGAVTLTSSTLWQVLGQRGGAGGDETWNIEPFTGIGIYARPPSSGNPEAIVVAIGGAKTTAIVATRDEATRKLGAGDLAEGETCVFNDKARIIVKADGTVEIRLHGGVAIPLATLADVQAIRAALDGHSHTYVPGSGTPTTTTANPAVPAPVGTTVLKAQ
jgi:phage gp45-like